VKWVLYKIRFILQVTKIELSVWRPAYVTKCRLGLFRNFRLQTENVRTDGVTGIRVSRNDSSITGSVDELSEIRYENASSTTASSIIVVKYVRLHV